MLNPWLLEVALLLSLHSLSFSCLPLSTFPFPPPQNCRHRLSFVSGESVQGPPHPALLLHGQAAHVAFEAAQFFLPDTGRPAAPAHVDDEVHLQVEYGTRVVGDVCCAGDEREHIHRYERAGQAAGGDKGALAWTIRQAVVARVASSVSSLPKPTNKRQG